MNILLLELDYLQQNNKRAHSACNSVQLAKVMQKYTDNKMYILADDESALLSYAKKQKLNCLITPSGFFSSLKLALLLKKHKIDIVHTFDLLSAQIATKALSFASSVKHIHTENRNTEKDDMLLSSAFKKLDACIFAHKSFEGQYKYKYVYQEEHRPVDFYVADIFPVLDMLNAEDDGVISLEAVDIIADSQDENKKVDKKFDINIGKNKEISEKEDSAEDIAQNATLLAQNEPESIENVDTKQERTLSEIENSEIKDSSDALQAKDLNTTKNFKKNKNNKKVQDIKDIKEEKDVEQSANIEEFLPYEVSKKKIRFLIPCSVALTDLDTITNALRCFHEYEGHIYKWEAYFVGPELDAEKVLKYAKKYDIQDYVVIFMKDLEMENFDKSEICIVPTFKDEYSLEALFNAWAGKKPTIITQRMPYFEKVVNSKTVLIPDLDTPLSLSSVMHKLVQDVECRATLLNASKSIDFEKEAQKTAEKYEKCYSEVKAKMKVK